MANTLFANPYPAADNFSDKGPEQYAEPFLQLIERNVNFACDAHGDADEFAKYTFRIEVLFSFSLRRPAAEWDDGRRQHYKRCYMG